MVEEGHRKLWDILMVRAFYWEASAQARKNVPQGEAKEVLQIESAQSCPEVCLQRQAKPLPYLPTFLSCF